MQEVQQCEQQQVMRMQQIRMQHLQQQEQQQQQRMQFMQQCFTNNIRQAFSGGHQQWGNGRGPPPGGWRPGM